MKESYINHVEDIFPSEMEKLKNLFDELRSIQTVKDGIAPINEKFAAILASKNLAYLKDFKGQYPKDESQFILAAINFLILKLREDFQEILFELKSILERERNRELSYFVLNSNEFKKDSCISIHKSAAELK